MSPFLVKAPAVTGKVTVDEGEEIGRVALHFIECTICKKVLWNELLLKAAFLKCFSDGHESKSSLALKN